MNSGQPATTSHSIELNIEQLVLHGFASGDRHGIAAAVQRELTRLLTEQGVPASMATETSMDRIDAGSFRLAGNTRAEAVGAQVAQSVYRGVGR